MNVTNGMSKTSSWLCPDVTVIAAPGPSAPVCQPSVAVVNASTLDSPRSTQRSQAVTIAATSQLQVGRVSASDSRFVSGPLVVSECSDIDF